MLKRIEPEVSDHALVRWIERVEGIDLTEFRKEILRICGSGLRQGASHTHHENITYVLGTNTVVTVIVREEGT